MHTSKGYRHNGPALEGKWSRYAHTHTHLPELEANEAVVLNNVVKLGVVNEVRVIDVRRNPLTLVSRVGDSLRLPLALLNRPLSANGHPSPAILHPKRSISLHPTSTAFRFLLQSHPSYSRLP